MDKRHIIGKKVICTEVDDGCEGDFTIGNIYEIERDTVRYGRILGDDGFEWCIVYRLIEDLEEWLNKNLTGTFKIIEEDNND